MKLFITFALLSCLWIQTQGAPAPKPQQSDWDKYPPQALKNGFWLQKSIMANMDKDPELEAIFLFGRDLGHYPYFDLFEYYYLIVDYNTRTIQYTSPNLKSSEMNILAEDRNQNGISELYVRYFKDGKFTTNQRGRNLAATWVCDTIELGEKVATTESELKSEHPDEPDPLPVAADDPAKIAKAPLRALIVTGQDGSHFWHGSSQALKTMMEDSSLFRVDIALTPNWGGDMTTFRPVFSDYNLVVVNYGGTTWPETTRKNFENYVSEGGGVVIIHSSVVPMDDWKEYNKIIGLAAWNNRNEKDGPYLYWRDGRYVYDHTPGWAGHHDRQHIVTLVHRAPEHPILAGLNPEWKHFKDEIYCRLRGPAENIEILATTLERGRDEPLLWTVQYGKGRVFVSLLGHCGNDPDMTYSMECSGYQTTLLRGAEWASTGRVTQGIPSDFPTKKEFKLRPYFKVPLSTTFANPKS